MSQREPAEADPSLLVVDDEPDMLTMLSFVLKREGFSITTVASGEAAIERLRERRFDLVLTDLRMPGMNGYETLREIRRIDPRTLVIVATGYATEDTAEECRAMGAYELIHKPFDVLRLRDLLRKALADRAGAASSTP